MFKDVIDDDGFYVFKALSYTEEKEEEEEEDANDCHVVMG